MNGRNISETVVNTAAASFPGHIAAQKNNFNGGGVSPAPGGSSAWNDLYRLQVLHAAQMVWHAYNDGACADNYKAQRMNAGTGSACKSQCSIKRSTPA